MSGLSFEHAAEARAALNAIVTDPQHGVPALSSSQTMSNLLKDLLPDAPREKSILVAAAEAGLPGTLREHVAQGMDPGTAVRLTASAFAASTPYPPQACTWVAEELAIALGVSEPRPARPASEPPPATAVAGGQPPAPSWPPGDQLAGQPAFPGQQPLGGQPPASSWPPAGQAAGPGGSWPVPGQGGFGAAQTAPGQVLGGFGQVPGQAFPAPGQPFLPVQPGRMVPKTNNLAIASLVCGLAQFIGWIVFLVPGLIAAILALAFGIASVRQIGRRGEGGRGMAIAGLILGALGLVGGVILIVAIAISISHSST